MCTDACPCDPGTPIQIDFKGDKSDEDASFHNISFTTRAVWETYGLSFIKSYGRVYTEDQMTEEQREAYEEIPDLAPFKPF